MKLYRTLRYYAKQFGSYHISTYAASASFFIITAIFPFLMLILSVISYTSFDTKEFLDMVASLLPLSFQGLFYTVSEDILTTSATALSVTRMADQECRYSLVGACWAARSNRSRVCSEIGSLVKLRTVRRCSSVRMVSLKSYSMSLPPIERLAMIV